VIFSTGISPSEDHDIKNFAPALFTIVGEVPLTKGFSVLYECAGGKIMKMRISAYAIMLSTMPIVDAQDISCKPIGMQEGSKQELNLSLVESYATKYSTAISFECVNKNGQNPIRASGKILSGNLTNVQSVTYGVFEETYNVVSHEKEYPTGKYEKIDTSKFDRFVSDSIFISFNEDGVDYDQFPNVFEFDDLVPAAMIRGESNPDKEATSFDHTINTEKEFLRYLTQAPYAMSADQAFSTIQAFKSTPSWVDYFTFHWVRPDPNPVFYIGGADVDYRQTYLKDRHLFVAESFNARAIILKTDDESPNKVTILGKLDSTRWKQRSLRSASFTDNSTSPISLKKLGRLLIPDETEGQPLPKRILWIIPGDESYSGSYFLEKESDYPNGAYSTYWGGPKIQDGHGVSGSRFKIKIERANHEHILLEYI